MNGTPHSTSLSSTSRKPSTRWHNKAWEIWSCGKLPWKRPPWEARLWLRLLEARDFNFYVKGERVQVTQANGVRQGSPDSPVLFAIGETLDATIEPVGNGSPPHVGRHPELGPPPHTGGAFMDDTYIWG